MNSKTINSTQTGTRKSHSKLNIAAISAAAAAAGIAGGALIEALRRRPIAATTDDATAPAIDENVAVDAAVAADAANVAAVKPAVTITEEVVVTTAPIEEIIEPIAPDAPVVTEIEGETITPNEPAAQVAVEDVNINPEAVVEGLINTSQVDAIDTAEAVFNPEAVGIINCADGKEHIVAAGTLPNGTVVTMIDIDDDGVFDIIADANLEPIAPLDAAYTASDVNLAINEGNHYIPIDALDLPVNLNDDPSRDVADYTDANGLNPSYGDVHGLTGTDDLQNAMASHTEEVSVEADAVEVDATEAEVALATAADPLTDVEEDMAAAQTDAEMDESFAFDDNTDPTHDFSTDIIDA